jgi:hypothetical protein
MRLYTLYLNTKTTTGFLAPTNKSNLNCVYFSVPWESVFPTSMNAKRYLNNNSKCRIKAQFVSAASTGITWTNQKGTLRIGGLASSSQNPTSGVILGVVKPVVSPIVATDWYLECDTTQSQGVEISMPTNNNICIGLYNDSGAAMTNALEYEVILHFEIEDDDSESRYIMNQSIPKMD